MVKFSQLQVGEQAKVIDMKLANPAYRQKLYALGLKKGSIFTVVQRALFGDPIVVDISGFALCLRRYEADCVSIERSE